jgi:hypothetical protein
MSEIPSEALSYRTVVAEYFLGLRGAGLLLSPLDEELVAEWERRGLPLAVVCRGIRRGLEQQLEERGGDRPGLPRSLRAYRFAVEDEWRAYRQGVVGQAPEAGSENLMARERLEAARRHLEQAAATDGTWRAAYLAAEARLADESGLGGDAAAGQSLRDSRSGRARAFPPPPGSTELSRDLTLDGVERALAAADQVLVETWLAALPRDQRSAVGPRLRLLAGPRPRRTRPRSYRQTLRSYLLDAARRAGLRCLRGSV